mmetsp:Transcript_21270/g.31268  ORF Transcript_21270/g.31268 Transcript_21270/m.31268 type:complete len:238 (+) Transcript_21270:753-1466(+)
MGIPETCPTDVLSSLLSMSFFSSTGGFEGGVGVIVILGWGFGVDTSFEAGVGELSTLAMSLFANSIASARSFSALATASASKLSWICLIFASCSALLAFCSFSRRASASFNSFSFFARNSSASCFLLMNSLSAAALSFALRSSAAIFSFSRISLILPMSPTSKDPAKLPISSARSFCGWSLALINSCSTLGVESSIEILVSATTGIDSSASDEIDRSTYLAITSATASASYLALKAS